ncbi:MAG: hypothetical protein EPN82_00550 [Bacteroidetes bacterium]|nr:MAG: hypothetical protein EPN82_00550 [Bacteroidota bacterium]
MKKSEIIVICLVCAIFLLQAIVILTSPIKIIIEDERTPRMESDSTKGVPIRADTGGEDICLTGTSSQKDKIFLRIQETTGYPLMVIIEGVSEGRLEPYDYMCKMYDYADPFPCKHVLLKAVIPTDPDSQNYHAKVILCSANPFALNTLLPDGQNTSHTFDFPSVPNERYYFIVIQNQVPPPPAVPIDPIIKVAINNVGGAPYELESYPISNTKILYYHAFSSTAVQYTLTHVSGNNVLINVYSYNKY